jgi:hypothetical protein
MTRRISIKGQGADIFFGEGEEPRQEPVLARQEAQGESVDVPTSVGASGQTAESADADEGRFLAGLLLPPALKRKLRAVLRDERRIHTTVRFSPEEMTALRDLVYDLEARKGIKVTRNEVMRIALHFFLEDYGIRKKESLLLQVLKGEEE